MTPLPALFYYITCMKQSPPKKRGGGGGIGQHTLEQQWNLNVITIVFFSGFQK